MKMNKHVMMSRWQLLIIGILVIPFMFVSCSDDDPKKEDTPELITMATLTFTPEGGGSAVVVRAIDPDGEGVQDIAPEGPINLDINTAYTLTVTLTNELADETDPARNITQEVLDEADEHMFFYAWTNNVFSNPAGNGNYDNRADAVNYNDEDVDGLPLGLSTVWTTTDVAAAGTFRVVLKHQPGVKSATSAVTDGETDLDITFTINVVD
jgi:hypothetical protein